MWIGVPKETAEGERRVAVRGGRRPDGRDAGAVYEADVVVKVAPPSAEEIGRLGSDGASGSILTNLMAKAMNHSVPAIVAGGFGGAIAAPAGGPGAEDRGPVRSTSAQDLTIQLSYAPAGGDRSWVRDGGGTRPARGPRARKGARGQGRHGQVRDPPGGGTHAGPHERAAGRGRRPLRPTARDGLDQPEFGRTDVTLVIGANDVTNPAAKNEPGSPIYGMPILEVDQSGSVVVLKRSMASGFAGIDNPLFYEPKTAMLFGDAKQSVSDITSEVPGL